MKTKRLLNIFILSSLVTIAACTEEETGDEGVVTTIRASIEQKAETKTHLSGPENNIYKTLWSEDDAIGVFASGVNPSEFKLTSGAGTNSGEFTGTIPSGKKIAVYPFSICESINESRVSIVLPEEQTYKEGNIPDGAYPMVATGRESTLNFKNLCSVLKISMTGSLTVNYISFSANDNNIKVAGKAMINADPESPDLTISEDGTSFVKLVCPAVSLSGAATDFFIVVPAQKYTGGFSLIIDTDKGKVQKTIETDVTLKRSELYRITPFECKIDEDSKNIIIEDKSFKAYLVSKFDKDKDGEISLSEAEAIEHIYVCTDSISSLQGIEYMPNLRTINCEGSYKDDGNGNKISHGQLKSIDISHNKKLYQLSCGSNKLTTVITGDSPEFMDLYCENNQLTSLDFSKNPKLRCLGCENNHLTSLALNNNPNLKILRFNNNQISGIDLSNNSQIYDLETSGNPLNTIDVSKISELKYFYCLDNNLSSLDVSKNLKLQRLNVSKNPLQTIDVSALSDLTSFTCNECSLSYLDVSNNTKLDWLSCYGNKLKELDLTYNPNLTSLQPCMNELTSVNISNCSKLTSINIWSNKLTSLDVTNCPELDYCNCSKNLIKSLDFSKCEKINGISCGTNNLSLLKVGNSGNLEVLGCENNNLTSLDISQNTGIRYLDARSNPLNTLYTYQDQLNKIAEAYLPDNVTVIVGSEPGEDEVFTVTPTLFDIDGYEHDITMTVTANISYSIDSQPEWISKKSDNSGVYTFTVSANTTSSSRSGEIIFKNVNNSFLTVTVKQGIQTYTSSDYSQDGQVTRIHSATVGKGIDVVFVGDAFADKDQNLFNKYVELGKEAFFTEEPFRSTKDRFNIYRIGSVSKNGIIAQEGGDTKFSAQFGQGTNISGNDEAVFNFVQEHMPSVDLTKTIIFVIINKAQYAGTCWMYSNNMAICYVPLCRDETDYAQTLRHEGCGHGFGKLADEYFYDSMGRIPDDEVTELKKWKGFAYGFHENVDLTSDPNTILWSKFISDSRYSGMVGVYEGGYTYPYGVYRPTDNSIMRYNTGGFNAPSREAIYKKIMKFSEGDAWTYDYETFVAFDAPARSAEATTRAAAQCAAVDKANFIPLAPPVMVMVDK